MGFTQVLCSVGRCRQLLGAVGFLGSALNVNK